ncbi:MAG TPA: CHRD domain-containing protein [Tepidisphaeraceae bacterium]|jgi:hypothetical protein
MRHTFKWALGLALAVCTSSALAASQTFNLNANGIKEVSAAGVPGQGDPDATAIGTLTLDDGTGGTTGTATFNVTFANLDFPITGYHIHQAPATTTGSIILDFQARMTAESIRNGNSFVGTVTGLNSTTIDNVLTNPSNFYMNFHNGTFPGGAVRDQLPEPGSLCLLALGGMTALLSRTRKRICNPRNIP